MLSGTSIVIARDINLDNIYIKKNSPNYKRLLNKKMDAYQAVNSRFIDRNVIFAHWLNGFEITYVKELHNTNIIYLYNKKTRKKNEIARLKGAISTVKTSSNEKYIIIKRIILNKRSIPVGETLLLNIISKKFRKIGTVYPFLDFTISPGGNSILYETRKGIAELFPESGIRTILIKKTSYMDIASANAPTIALISPNRKKFVLLNGSGGRYKSKILTEKKSWKLSGVTSAAEIFWISNSRIIYRKGTTGNFSVNIYNLDTRRSKNISGNSLNTNIQYSKYPKIVSFLKDQLINIYDLRKKKKINTGLEGEDIHFSPDGNRFVSILFKKLFLTRTNTISRKTIELKKISAHLARLYKKILKSRKYWANQYSKHYIQRKISAYKSNSL